MKISLLPQKFLILLFLLLLETGIVSVAYGGVAYSVLLPPRGLKLHDVVLTTLAQQPTIAVSREQLIQSDGAIKLTRAEFDWTLESNLKHGADYLPTGASMLYDRIVTTLCDTRLVIKTDFGFSLEPAITINSAISDAVPGNALPSTEGTSFRLSFTLVLPMLQGAGKTVVTARETAARYDLQHTISLAAYDYIVQPDELDENILDNVFLAGGMFDRMLITLIRDEG